MTLPAYIATANVDLNIISQGDSPAEAYNKFKTQSLERHLLAMAKRKKRLERFILVEVYSTKPALDNEMDWEVDKHIETHKPDITDILNKPNIVTQLIYNELETLYEREQIDEWWRSGQPLLDNRLPDDLIASGKGNDVLNLLRCLNDGAYI